MNEPAHMDRWIACRETRDPENLRWFAFAMPQNAQVEGSIPFKAMEGSTLVAKEP
ncbi:hypothetical protein RE411_23755 (plasmid) [Agrobacterium pusense]|uniref:hypothetical protein n=1 Tax=Agrobacterium pusense TaxID=648995 RepID=UPI0012E75564|nr:hypothetical protein [Agrobacterium pusense]WMW59169.1 hypothetical protein RE411_23755 [Agrobacterium pusense]